MLELVRSGGWLMAPVLPCPVAAVMDAARLAGLYRLAFAPRRSGETGH